MSHAPLRRASIVRHLLGGFCTLISQVPKLLIICLTVHPEYSSQHLQDQNLQLHMRRLLMKSFRASSDMPALFSARPLTHELVWRRDSLQNGCAPAMRMAITAEDHQLPRSQLASSQQQAATMVAEDIASRTLRRWMTWSQDDQKASPGRLQEVART